MRALREKICFLSILFFVILGAGGCGQKRAPEAESEAVTAFTGSPERIEEAAKCVVKLEVFDESEKRIAVGSGFCAVGEGYLITSAHVVKHMAYAVVTEDNGQSFRIDRLIACDDIADVAILDLGEHSRENFLPVGETLPLRGENVAVIGTTAGFVNLVTLGNVSKIWENDGNDRILFTAPVSSGNSGGPVLNDRGEVIGVVMGTYDYAENLNVAISIGAALNLLKSEE